MNLNPGQQWAFKNISFIGCTTGVKASGTNIVFTASFFQFCEIGIDASGTSGSLLLIDSSAHNVGTLVKSYDSGNASNSIVLENVESDGITVTLNGNTVLIGSVTDTWVHGNSVSSEWLEFSELSADTQYEYTSGNSNRRYQAGATFKTLRTSPLLTNGRYFSLRPPTYQEYSIDQVVNIKSVSGLPVFGDGSHDDTANINTILSQYAGCKIVYFPAGTYIVTNTILVPVGSRIFGDAYASAISAVGSNFYNPNKPTTMVQVGNAGDVGVAQLNDMLFTVADVLAGCKLVRVYHLIISKYSANAYSS
jgi:glucan 1,3-beta-glucosidase